MPEVKHPFSVREGRDSEGLMQQIPQLAFDVKITGKQGMGSERIVNCNKTTCTWFFVCD